LMKVTYLLLHCTGFVIHYSSAGKMAVPWLQVVSYWAHTAEAWIPSQANLHEILGGQSSTGTFTLSAAVFPCQYHSINAPSPYSSHLPLTLYHINSWQCHYINYFSLTYAHKYW
jgi:hypothetical protein